MSSASGALPGGTFAREEVVVSRQMYVLELWGVWKWKCSSQHLDGSCSCQVKKTRDAHVSGKTIFTHHFFALDSNRLSVRFCGRTHRTMHIEPGAWAVRVLLNTMPNVNGESLFRAVLCPKLQI